MTINIGPIETILVSIIYRNITYHFSSIYIPPNISITTLKTNFELLIEHTKQIKNIMIGGDVNATHAVWDNAHRTNGKGKIIAETLGTSHFYISNNGMPTRQSLSNFTNSAIDITFSSPDISYKIDWTISDDNLGSDHLPIQITLKTTNNQNTFTRTRINYNKLTKKLGRTNFDDTENITEFENKLTAIIDRHTVNCDSKKSDKPWWNEKLKRLWIIKREKQRIYNRNRNLFTATELKLAITNFKCEMNTSKKNAWDLFTSEIKPTTSLKDIYRKVNLFNNKHIKKTNIFLDSNDKLQNLLTTNYDDIDYSLTNVEKQYNEDIILEKDIETIIKLNNNSSGGINQISNRILKLLNKDQIGILTKHLNKAWNLQEFPDSWKNIRAIAFPKPHKDESNLTNYRIISLLNVIHKLFSKVIKPSIINHINEHKIIPRDSYGFREGVGINEFCVRLIQILEKNKQDKFGSVVLVVDVSKAFDKVNSNTLHKQLIDMKFEQKYIYWILQGLRNRNMTIDSCGNKAHKILSEGVPQGDVLSPTLFNIYSAEIHQLQNNYTDILQYADDFVFIIKDKNMSDLNSKSSLTLRKIKYKFDSLNFRVNPVKCEYMTFNCQTYHRWQVYMFDDLIKKVDCLKILGINFDRKLNFAKHYRTVKHDIQKYMNIFKIFNNKQGGAHPKSLLNVHNALIKSRTNFGAPCILSLNKKNNHNYQTIHNNSLRFALGLAKTCPITAILGEAAEWPIEKQIQWTTIKFICKHINRNTEIGIDIVNRKSTDTLNRIYSEYPILKCIPNIKKTNITNTNLFVNCYLDDYNNCDTNLIKKITAQTTIDKFNDAFQIFTDGSKTENGIGLGIFFVDSNETIKYASKLDLSIKTVEIMAIYIGLKMALSMRKTNIVLFTDSLSSCLSIKNALAKKHNRYYEHMIIDLANKYSNSSIRIQWIPAHVGIDGNETADRLARESLTSSILDDSACSNRFIPTEDILHICKQLIHKKWTSEFINITENKGKFHAQILKKPTLKPWFKKTNLNSSHLKKILRIRSGHTFDKKYKFRLKLTDTNICTSCNTIEDIEHIITHCTLYQNTRQKYPDILRKSLTQLLETGDETTYITIINYLKDINYNT